MSKPGNDDEDLTRVLDGWTPSPGRTDPDIDPTRVLDGWRPDGGPGRMPERAPTETIRPPGRGAAPDPRNTRLPDDLNLHVPTRYSKWDDADVTDVDAVWKPSAEVTQAAQQALAPPADDGWQPQSVAASRRESNPRVLGAWKPGAWIGAARQVFDAVARVVSTAQGPVVDTYPPHVLLALWPPQSVAKPFLDRWPQRIQLSAVPQEEAAQELLKHLPADAELWLSEAEIDWALVGEAVLLHDPGVRDFQLEKLRAFVEAERQATWDRVNQAYRLPEGGRPIERV